MEIRKWIRCLRRTLAEKSNISNHSQPTTDIGRLLVIALDDMIDKGSSRSERPSKWKYTSMSLPPLQLPRNMDTCPHLSDCAVPSMTESKDLELSLEERLSQVQRLEKQASDELQIREISFSEKLSTSAEIAYKQYIIGEA